MEPHTFGNLIGVLARNRVPSTAQRRRFPFGILAIMTAPMFFQAGCRHRHPDVHVVLKPSPKVVALWRKVIPGMTDSQVQQVLGKPISIIGGGSQTAGGTEEIWQYFYPIRNQDVITVDHFDVLAVTIRNHRVTGNAVSTQLLGGLTETKVSQMLGKPTTTVHSVKWQNSPHVSYTVDKCRYICPDGPAVVTFINHSAVEHDRAGP